MSLQACASEIYAFLKERNFVAGPEEQIRLHDLAALCNNIQKLKGIEPMSTASTRRQAQQFLRDQLGEVLPDVYCPMRRLREVVNFVCDTNLTPTIMQEIDKECALAAAAKTTTTTTTTTTATAGVCLFEFLAEEGAFFAKGWGGVNCALPRRSFF